MPNVGRPSKGCKICRERKLKCDLKRPSCSPCIRSGQRCHGYRDPNSMVFKDESLVVAKKAEKRYEKLARQKSQAERDQLTPQSSASDSSELQSTPSPKVSQSSSQVAPWSRYPTPESLVAEIVPSVEDQALGFFISNHVSQPTIVPRGQFEWITELLSQPNPDEMLRSIVNAVSLAGLANSTKNPMLMNRAHAAYGTALKMTNNALQARDLAMKDTTLISVIMLGMYEAFVYDRHSVEAWSKHTDGACALINLRGKEQFMSSVARRVFHQYYGVVLLVSLETGRPIPKGIRELYDYLVPTSDYTVQGRQWTTRLVHFMTDSINLSEDGSNDPVSMVRKAINLDRELDRIKALIPKVWCYQTVHLKEPVEHVYGTSYHIYIDSWIVQMWNNLRSSRMHLYKVIHAELLKGYTQHSPPLFSREEFESQIKAAEQVIHTTTAAICASVPQISEMIAFPQPSTPDAGGVFSSSDERYKLHPRGTFFDPSRPTGLHHLIWPLYSSASSDLASIELRDWTIETLYYIALRVGTRQAVVLADELKGMHRVEDSGD